MIKAPLRHLSDVSGSWPAVASSSSNVVARSSLPACRERQWRIAVAHHEADIAHDREGHIPLEQRVQLGLRELGHEELAGHRRVHVFGGVAGPHGIGQDVPEPIHVLRLVAVARERDAKLGVHLLRRGGEPDLAGSPHLPDVHDHVPDSELDSLAHPPVGRSQLRPGILPGHARHKLGMMQLQPEARHHPIFWLMKLAFAFTVGFDCLDCRTIVHWP